MQSSGIGLVLLITTLLSPDVGLSGIIAVLTAFAFARFIGMGDEFLKSGFYTYNALLVGLALGNLFKLSVLSLLFTSAAGVMSLLVSVITNNVFRQFFGLPILSLPFVAVSSVAYLASSKYSGLYVTGLYAHHAPFPLELPPLFDGFFSSLGAVFFMPYASAGMLFFIALLWHSRIQAILAFAGFALGTVVSSWLGGDYLQAVANLNNFNFILIAMALGGLFLAPSPKSYLIAAIAVVIAAVLQDAVNLFWSQFGLPVFTLPFNLVTLSFLYVLGLVGFPYVADYVGRTPEATLDDFHNRHYRFPKETRRLLLPFAGEWRVWQGFDGEWTHQGAQQHACDFILEMDGKSYRNDGSQLDDYHAWRKPVLAPIKGRVVARYDTVVDNPPGEVNRVENWGNWVIIDSGFGWHVLIAHFACGSIKAAPGQWLEAGACIGLCGNSGYSPQPHIHIHVQYGDAPGAATLPFLFQSYADQNRFIAAGVPSEKSLVEALAKDHELSRLTALILDQTYRYRLIRDGKEALDVEVKVAMSEAGETLLQTENGQLYFNNDAGSFYFYRIEGDDPMLAMLFSVLPRLPLHYKKGLVWSDRLPLAARYSGASFHALCLLRSLWPKVGRQDYYAQWLQPQKVVGKINEGDRVTRFEVELAATGLIDSVRMPGIELSLLPKADIEEQK